MQLLIGRDDVNVDSKDNEGRTPLSVAAEEGYEDIVQLLTGRDDVDVDSEDKHGRTPLSHVVYNRKVDIVRLLLNRKDVKLDLKDSDGKTLLPYPDNFYDGFTNLSEAELESKEKEILQLIKTEIEKRVLRELVIPP